MLPPSLSTRRREHNDSLRDRLQEPLVAAVVCSEGVSCGCRYHKVGLYVVEEVHLEVEALSTVRDSGGIGDQEIGRDCDFRCDLHCLVFQFQPRPADGCGGWGNTPTIKNASSVVTLNVRLRSAFIAQRVANFHVSYFGGRPPASPSCLFCRRQPLCRGEDSFNSVAVV